jgi:hypothetical protein
MTGKIHAKSNRRMTDSRLLLVLVVIFAVLVVIVMIQNGQPATSATTTQTCSTCVFTDLQLDDIQAIRLRSPETGQTLSIARDAAGDWTAPETTGTLDTAQADLIARTMVLLPFSRTLPLGADEDKTVFGFTPEGILSIEIVAANGGSHVAAVGYRTPTEESYYALVDNRPDLYLLERAAVDFLIAQLKNPPLA